MVTSVGGNRLRWCTQRAGVKPEFTFEERVQRLLFEMGALATGLPISAIEALVKKQGPGPLLPICPEFRRAPVGRIIYLTPEQREEMIPTVKKQMRAVIRKEERKKYRSSPMQGHYGPDGVGR